MELRHRLRDLDVFQRVEGFNALRMVTSRKSFLYFGLVMMPVLILPPGILQYSLLAIGIYFVNSFYWARYGPVVPRPVLIRLHRRINDYEIATFPIKFRFLQHHAHAVMSCLGVGPQDVICDNGSRAHCEEAFLILLFRMARPRTLVEASAEFGIENTQVCRIFNTTMQMVVMRNHLLVFDNIPYFVPRFPMYNQALRAKILSLGQTLPAAALDTALLSDGKSVEVLRLGGPHIRQARIYNGHHRVHCLQFQTSAGLDGMVVDLFGPIAGARHDEAVNRMSEFNTRLAAAQIHQVNQYSDYKDKGYVARSHGHVAYRGRNLPQQLIDANAIMSPQRVGVEWIFNKIDQLSCFILAPRVHNIQVSAVGSVYILGAILTNCHTCLTGSAQSVYWNVQPPKLGHYFGRPDIVV